MSDQNQNNKKSRKGKDNPMFHKTHSDETKEKIRQKIKALWRQMEEQNNDSTV